MLGWHISVYRQADGGGSPAPFAEPTGPRIAVWQAGIDAAAAAGCRPDEWLLIEAWDES